MRGRMAAGPEVRPPLAIPDGVPPAAARSAGRGVRRWTRDAAGMGSSAGMRGRRSLAFIVALIIACLAQMRTTLAREAVLLDVNGAIGPATTAYLRRAFRVASDRGAALVV